MGTGDHRQRRASARRAGTRTRPDGFAITASKTVAVPIERLCEAFVNESLCGRWLPNATLRLRTATLPQSARYDWEDGATRANVGVTRLTKTKSRLGIRHERLPNADAAEEMTA